MITTVLSLLLAGAATGDVPEPGGLASSATYGTYGSYGSYGWYSTYPGRNNGRGGWVIPYFICPTAVGEEKKEKEVLDKKLTELKNVLGNYEKKISLLEKKLELQDKNTETQAHIMELLDKKLADNQERLMQKLASIQEAGTNDQLKAVFVRLEDRLQRMEEKFRAAPVKETRDTSLEQRIAMLEHLLKVNTNIGSTIQQGFNSIEKKLGNSNSGEQKVAVVDPRARNPLLEKTGVPFNRGLIVVSLPADAKLFLDNHPSVVGTNLRSFISPELELNKNYFYTIRAELERGGRIFTESQRVYFQPGREVRVSFDHLEATAAGVQANTVKTN